MSDTAPEFPPEEASAEQDAMAAEWEAALAQQTSASGGADAAGQTAQEYEPDGKAATEIKDIIVELMAMKAIQEDGIDRSEKKFNTIE